MSRKSNAEGLEQEFNTLHAQRLAGENFVRSQAGEGWEVVPDHYDDGGFTGANMERPALQRLLAGKDLIPLRILQPIAITADWPTQRTMWRKVAHSEFDPAAF